MRNLSRCPGGLEAVQNSMAAVWPHLFEGAYDDWRALREAAEYGSVDDVKQLLEAGAYTDLPSNDAIQPLAAAVLSKVMQLERNTMPSNSPTKVGVVKNQNPPMKKSASVPTTPVEGKHGKGAGSSSLKTGNTLRRLSSATTISGEKAAGLDAVIAALAKAGASRLSAIDHNEWPADLVSKVLKNKKLQTSAFQLIDRVLQKDYPIIDIGLHSAMDEAGVRLMVAFHASTRKLTSMVGCKPDQRELEARGFFLKSAALPLMQFETQLERLDLSHNPTIKGTLDPISKLSRLIVLNLSQCKGLQGTLEPLSHLVALQKLNLSARDTKFGPEPNGIVGDLQPLSSCTQLTHLSLYGCHALMGETTPLASCTNLMQINLGHILTLHGTLAPFSNMPKLQTLNISNTPCITGDITHLSGLQELVELDMHECIELSGSLKCLESSPLLDMVNVLNTQVKSDCCNLGNCTIHAM